MNKLFKGLGGQGGEKPMLFQKLKEDGRCRPRNVIGLMGVHPGAGVTYTSIIISFLWEKI